MGLEIPDSLQWVAKYVVGGGDWPEGDETAMRRLADSWDGLAETLGTIDEDADTVIRDVLTALSAGQAHDAVSTMWAPIGGDQGAIEELIKRCKSQADSLDNGANDIEHTKYTIIAAMIILAAELAVALATSWTGIGAAAGVAARVATQVAIRMVVRGLIQRILSRMLAKAALRAAAFGAFSGLLEEGGSDLAARLLQVAQGHRDGLTAEDWKAVGLVSLAGTAGGAVGGGLGSGGALHGLTNQVENRVSRLGAQAAADTASGVAGEVAGQLAIVPFGGELNLGVETLTSSASTSVATTAASAGPHGHNSGGEHSSGETQPDSGQPAPATDNPGPSKAADDPGGSNPAADPGKPAPATTDPGGNTATEPAAADTTAAPTNPSDTQTSSATPDSGQPSQPGPTDSAPAQPSQATHGPAPSDIGPAPDSSHAAPPDTGTTHDPGTTPVGTDTASPTTSNPNAPASPDTLAPDTGVSPTDSHTAPPGPQDNGSPNPATIPTPHETGTGTPDLDTSVSDKPTFHDSGDPTQPAPHAAEPKPVVPPLDTGSPHLTPEHAAPTPATPDTDPASTQTSSSTTTPATSTPSMAGITPHTPDTTQRPAPSPHTPATDTPTTAPSRPETAPPPTLPGTSTRPDPTRPDTAPAHPDASRPTPAPRNEQRAPDHRQTDTTAPGSRQQEGRPTEGDGRPNAADEPSTHDEDLSDMVQTGGSVRPRNHLDDDAQQAWANDAYEVIRASTNDVRDMVENLATVVRPDGTVGFTEQEISQIKQHVFHDEHRMSIFDRDGHVVGYENGRFDADADMAEAWMRLSRGEPLPSDIKLLEHELAESSYLQQHPDASYREAHAYADSRSKWQDDIPTSTGENYERWAQQDGPVRGVPESGGNPYRGDVPLREQRERPEPATGDNQGGAGRPSGGRYDGPTRDQGSGQNPRPSEDGRNVAGRGRDSGVADPGPDTGNSSLDLPPIEAPEQTAANPDSTHDRSAPSDRGRETPPEWSLDLDPPAHSPERQTPNRDQTADPGDTHADNTPRYTSLNIEPDTYHTRAAENATRPVGEAPPANTPTPGTTPSRPTPVGTAPHHADTTPPPVGPDPRPDDVRPGPERTHTPPEQPIHPDGPPRSPTDDDSPARPDEPRPSLRDMFPSNGLPADSNRLLPLLRQAIDGEYGGLRVEVEKVTCIPNEFSVKGKIWSLPDKFGYRRLVGEFSRDFTIDGDGRITANHDFLKVEEDVQGRGFATEFNRAMFDWYRESGVHKVTLLANIDVGSYAWARHGFTFADQHIAIDQIRPRLEDEIDRAVQKAEALRQQLNSLPPGQGRAPLEKQLADLDSMISQGQAILDRFKVGSPNFPTPKEISQLGRPTDLSPEEARDQSWPGKKVFMEPGESILWNGELILEPDTGHPLSSDNPAERTGPPADAQRPAHSPQHGDGRPESTLPPQRTTDPQAPDPRADRARHTDAHQPTRDPSGHRTDSFRNSNPDLAPDTHSAPNPGTATPAVGDAAPVNTPTPGSTPFQPTPVGPDLRRPDTTPPPVGPDPHPDDVRPEPRPTNAPPGQPTRSDMPHRSPASTPPPTQPTGPYPGQGHTPEPPRWAHQNPNHHADATRLPDWWPQPTSGPAATPDNSPTTRHPAPGAGNPGRATPAPYSQPHPAPGENLTRAPESNPPARPVPPPHTPRPTAGPPPNTPPNGPGTQPRAGLPPHSAPPHNPGTPLYGAPHPQTPPRAGLPPQPATPNNPGTPPRTPAGTPPRAGFPPHLARPDATGIPPAQGHRPGLESAPTTPIPHARPNIPGATPPHAGAPPHPGQPNATGTPPAHTRPPNDPSRPPHPAQPYGPPSRPPMPPATRPHDPATRPPHPSNRTPYNDRSTAPPHSTPPSHPARPTGPRPPHPAAHNQPTHPTSPLESRGRPDYRGEPNRIPGQHPGHRPPEDHTGTPPRETTSRPQEPHPGSDRSPATDHVPGWDGRHPTLSPGHPARQPGAEHWRPEPGMESPRRPETTSHPEHRPPEPVASRTPEHNPVERGPRRPHEDPSPDRTDPPPPTDTRNDSQPRPDEPRPRLRDLFPPEGMTVDPVRLLPLLRRAIDGEYGGLLARVVEVNGNSDTLHVTVKLFDSSGNEVGIATRTYYLNGGHPIANHTKFTLDENLQSQGCATEFNNALFDWYAESGVDRIILRANIDVGSYAWTRQGFKFANEPQAVQEIRPRLKREIDKAAADVEVLRREMDSLPDGPEKSQLKGKIEDLESTIKQGRKILARFRVGSDNFPTPMEISQLGRPVDALPGQSRELSWLGKRVFMEPGLKISWQAVKYLNEE